MPPHQELSPVQPHRKVAVIGATGAIGFTVSRALAGLGHDVLAISRARTDDNASKIEQLTGLGATVRYQPDLADVSALAADLEGHEILVVAMRASPRIVEATEPAILEAATRAGIARLVPSEFGTHTMAVDYGISGQFDAKKRFLEQLFASGLDWTIVYAGGIAEYFLPSLRYGETIQIFGDTSLPWPTHTLHDIGAISARAVTDERTINRAVQLWANLLTTEQTLAALREAWPEREFDIDHVSSEQLEHLSRHANADPGKKRLSEREIMGIAYANFVLGKLGVPDHPGTVNASDLYPEYVYEDPLELLQDPLFVFGAQGR